MSQAAITFELVRAKREEIQRIAAQTWRAEHPGFRIGGRRRLKTRQRIDFLIDVDPVTSSWFPAGPIQDLESVLGRRVEVVTERGLNHLIREDVLREAVPV